MKSPIGNKLRLAYYDASDGPRIMLFGPLEVDLLSLQQLFRRLAAGEGPFDLHALPFVEAFGGVRLTLQSSGPMFASGRGKPQGIRLTSSESPEFQWRRTAEGWDYLAELIDGIVKNGGSGHQYLTAYPNEDAIVVVSKGEYSDEVLQS
jgi:hypothetical protein